jgi:DNA-binding MarR family transcriptional regulator
MSKKYLQQLASILEMLDNLDKDLNLVKYNETEKKIYYTIASKIHSSSKCNITDVIESSGFSRSTVYKAIRKFEDDRMVQLIKSNADRREVYLDLIAV